MPREAKPYAERGWYVSRPFGTYLKLCRVEEGMTEAKKLLKQELGKLEAEREHFGGHLPAKLTVIELFVMFLVSVKSEKNENTFRDYQRWCTEFAKSYGNKPARAITRAEANDFKLGLMNRTYVTNKHPHEEGSR